MDVSLLNTLWKLLGTFYNRDYFVFVGELLPFVARHYSVVADGGSYAETRSADCSGRRGGTFENGGNFAETGAVGGSVVDASGMR